MGSSLPNHDAKVGIGQTEKRQRRKNKEDKKDKMRQKKLTSKAVSLPPSLSLSLSVCYS